MNKSIVGACLALPLCAMAGRPLVTEDVRTLDDRACQLESWMNRAQNRTTQFWAVPACTYAGLEVQIGGERSRGNGVTTTTAVFTQGKYAFRSIDDGSWGAAIVAGIQRLPNRESENGWGDTYVILPLSLALGTDRDRRTLAHLNLGMTRLREGGRNLVNWGAALETSLMARLAMVAETYGQNAAKPFFRLGGRYALIDGALDLDLTYVTRSGGTSEDRLWSLGFHWQSAPFLP